MIGVMNTDVVVKAGENKDDTLQQVIPCLMSIRVFPKTHLRTCTKYEARWNLFMKDLGYVNCGSVIQTPRS